MADEPMDTLDQVIAYKLNPRFVHACCDPKEKEIAGCSVAYLCDLPDKFKGPVQFGVRMLKPATDGTVIQTQNIIKCHTFIHLRENLMDNGGSLDIIAREGEEIEVMESERILDPSAEGGVRYELKAKKKIVPKHPRLRDLPQYRNRLVLQQKQEDFARRERQERGARQLGLTPGEAGVQTYHPAADAAAGEGSGRSDKAVP